jgi:hypothetical protein
VNFTKGHLDMRMNEHPIASKFPLATGKVAIYPGPRVFHSLALGPGAPRKLEDFIYSDLAQVSLHITTFADGTVMGLCHSHITAGLSAFTAVINAWSLTLAGKSDLVPPFAGFYEDGMKGLLDPPAKEKHVLAGKEVSGWRLAYWSLRTLYESKRSPLEYLTFCIPKSTMGRIMSECRSSIACKKSTSTTSTDKEPFITEGDVLAAIACQSMARNQQPGSTRTLVTMMALDPLIRASSAFRKDAAYVQNVPSGVFFNCPANKALEASLGELALLVRDTIMTQSTEEQIKAYTSMSAVTVKENGRRVFFGDKDMSLQIMSNWVKANVFERVDFSPAIVKEGPESGPGRKRGHPTYYTCGDTGDIDEPLIIPLWTVMGADYDGNIWFSCALSRHTWIKLFEFLESFEYYPMARL